MTNLKWLFDIIEAHKKALKKANDYYLKDNRIGLNTEKFDASMETLNNLESVLKGFIKESNKLNSK